MTAPSGSKGLLVALSVAASILIVSLVVQVEGHHAKRTQYHEQGVHGHKSYKFGYTTGDHKNPMERHETADKHGNVKGWYSYVDPTGKHQLVHYESHPKRGFKVYSHKWAAHHTGKRHYAS